MGLVLEVMILFALLSLGASFVNGALGYGYSSISTPLALLVLVNKIVNPAYVLLEAMANTVMAIVSGKKILKATFRRTLPIIVPIVPGAILGSLVLAGLATSAPNWARFIVYAMILPLILLQATGIRKSIKKETHAGIPLGFGIGLLYSITTISGPPIALFLNNQGLKREEFKASVAQVRITESYITCVAYYFLGLFGTKSIGWFGSITPIQLFEVIAPPVLIGLPLGMIIARHLNIETFRRICMSFDAWIVGFGFTRVLVTFFSVNINLANALYAGIVVLSLLILYRYLVTRTKSEYERVPIATRELQVSDPPLKPGSDQPS
ncbi:MAG: sulfite exporter TauE/SafE family protein [archaeon]|nr:sulfite exporter TauE/SafE family protein [archaeon]